ncbi:unnamed protein product [Phytophthora fragariaefolia]|uniref:Unnamed protein product n=1 Tax=Phytophthora fragariaefolia TaxID=1490495 RepID=A0A9W6XXM4_9STRA|nr:unnamed protein product [Phytophthora fragariaefolia]
MPDIIESKRRYPIHSQFTDCAKYHGKLKGTKPSQQVMNQMIRGSSFNPTGDQNKALFFCEREHADGYPYIERRTYDDSFGAGVTIIALINASISRFTLYHADA